MLNILTIYLVFTLYSIVLFAIVYCRYRQTGFTDALYMSTMIQTLIGIEYYPRHNIEKLAIIAQSIISYLLTAHIIVISYNIISKI